MKILSCSIPGDPVGKGRPRVAVRGGFARAYTPAKTAGWEGGASMVVRAAWAGQEPYGGAVRVEVDAVSRRPKALLPKSAGGSAPASRPPAPGRCWRPTKPDADNVLKAALDVLVKAGVLRDDVQAVEVVARSLYAALAEGPCVEVRVSVVGGAP